MAKIKQTIKSFLQEYDLDKPDLVYIVAFSGGYDSMCLLHCLKSFVKNKIIAIHLNHKWRGDESDLEEQNCKQFCEQLDVEFYSENLSSDIPHTETAAREARYEFFYRCAKKYSANIIFTAHNKNDNVETLIYRISMGTGVSGLKGICAKRDIFYRPLLSVCREDIEHYCSENNLNPNNDSSNSNTKYKRNLIRTKILPLLKDVNSNIIDAVTSLSEVALEETQIVEEYISEIVNRISNGKKIDTKRFLSFSDAVQKRIVYGIFQDNNLEYDRKKILKTWEFLIENSKLKSGKTASLTNNLWIFVNEKFIEIISKKDKEFDEILITKEGTYQVADWIFEIEKYTDMVEKFPLDKDLTAYVEFPNGIPENFVLRHRKDGDIIHPLGSSGSQKLKKYLNEKKIPNHEKETLYFLASCNEIFWAISLGISDKIKVTNKPTHRLKFYKNEGK